MRVVDWRPTIPLQSEAAECGVVCVSALTAMYGKEVSAAAIKRRFGISTRGLAISQLLAIVRKAGFEATAVIVDFSLPSAIHEPCIAIKDRGHFVVLGRRRGRLREIFDPESGWDVVEEKDLSCRLDGPVVEITGVPDMPSIEGRDPLRLLAWLGKFRFVRRLAPMTGLALLTQCLVLITPLIAKFILERAQTGASPLGIFLAVASFVGISASGVLVRNSTRRLAARVSGRLGTELVHDMSRRVLSLPVHVLARFAPETLTGKIRTVRLVQEIVLRISSTTIVLCAVSFIAFVVITLLDARFAAVLAVSTTIGFSLDRWMVRHVGAATERLHRATTIQSAGLNEMTKAAAAISAYQAEDAVLERRQQENRALESATVQLDDAKRLRDGAKSLIVILDYSTFLGLGAWLLSKGQLTFGGFVALGLYRELVNQGVSELRDALAEARVLQQAKGRLEEIITTSMPRDGQEAIPPVDEPFSICVRGLSFRYSAFDPWIFQNANLFVAAGECIAVVGPSGCGKTTLAKLLVGALEPNAGSVAIASIQLGDNTRKRIMSNVGTVMQFDHLLSGTVAENISFFRPATFEQICEAARFAEIASVIEALPMKYQTPISDAFAGLSGGQRQRILIARAICGTPKLLIMDEATSFLDANAESVIANRVKELGITRIVFAHREETIRSADRVIDCRNLNSPISNDVAVNAAA